MLSKSKGQILRVAATMHVMFNWETPHSTLIVISDEAMKAAIDFVEICNHHVNYLTGKDNINDEIENLSQSMQSTCVCTHVHLYAYSYIIIVDCMIMHV